jgi:hypothetical protein
LIFYLDSIECALLKNCLSTIASLQSRNNFTEQPVAVSVRNRRLTGEKITLDDGHGKHTFPIGSANLHYHGFLIGNTYLDTISMIKNL